VCNAGALLDRQPGHEEKTMRTVHPILAGIVLLSSAVIAHAVEPAFQGLGILWKQENYKMSYGEGISPDGGTVVGANFYSSSWYEAHRWTADSGMTPLGDIGGGLFKSRGYDASTGGAIVVGYGLSSSGFEACYWTADDTLHRLGDIPGGNYHSEARAVTPDGTVIVGSGYNADAHEAFRWTAEGGLQPLGDLFGKRTNWSAALGVSDDGEVIVGQGRGRLGNEAWRWTEADGMVGLGDLPGGRFESQAQDCSADGSVVVGHGYNADDNNEAARWTLAGGPVGLGDLPGGAFHSVAWACSADGAIVVGNGRTDRGNEAFIWDETHGMRLLEDVLENDCGLDLTGWYLDHAAAISADGTRIVGWGHNPDGNTEGYVATVPEPSTVALLAVGLAAFLRRRRPATA
jgi:uncharacterized membrane protein